MTRNMCCCLRFSGGYGGRDYRSQYQNRGGGGPGVHQQGFGGGNFDGGGGGNFQNRNQFQGGPLRQPMMNKPPPAQDWWGSWRVSPARFIQARTHQEIMVILVISSILWIMWFNWLFWFMADIVIYVWAVCCGNYFVDVWLKCSAVVSLHNRENCLDYTVEPAWISVSRFFVLIVVTCTIIYVFVISVLSFFSLQVKVRVVSRFRAGRNNPKVFRPKPLHRTSLICPEFALKTEEDRTRVFCFFCCGCTVFKGSYLRNWLCWFVT